MAIRIKNRWHRSERNAVSPRTLEDHASALAFIAWRLALENAKELHREGYEYASDRERVGVLSELLAFEVQHLDRQAALRMDDDSRAVLVQALGARVADQIQDNLVDIAGPGNYRAPFIALLNRRTGDYAQLGYCDGQPGYDVYRRFAHHVLDALGESQTNRWVIDQVIEITAPEVVERLDASVANLMD